MAATSSIASAWPKGWTWLFGAAGAGMVVLYYAVLSEGAQLLVYQCAGVAAVAALVAGILRHRPPEPRAWWLFAGGTALFIVGDAIWYVYELRGAEPPFPSVADLVYTAGYPLLVAAVVSFSRRGRVGALGGLVDSAIVGGGAGLVLFLLVFEPAADTSGASGLARAVSVGYPVADAILLVAIMQVYFASGVRGPSLRALVGVFAALLVADIGYGVQALGGSYFAGDWLDAGWLAAYVLSAFAALHPSMRVFSRERQRPGRLTYRRLAAVGIAVLAIPLVMVVAPDRSHHGLELYVTAAWGCAMIVLVFARMGLLLAEHRRRESEQVRLEEQLRQSQKMEAVGKLAGGIAHDFNNLLLVVRGHAELARAAASDGSATVRSDLDTILGAVEKAASLTQQLLAFSRRQVLQPKVVDLNEIVRHAEGLLRRVIGADVEVDVALERGPWRVVADPGQLIQVLLNLAVNARDAMPRGGRLSLRTERVVADGHDPEPRLAARPGSYVLLSVADTGVGMDAETRARAFEPFFTTKPLGTGTGLGLATVLGIVEQSGGFVFIESERGHGTTVRILLPATEEAASVEPEKPEPEPEPEPEHAPAGRETIVLVEDDDAVRGLVAAMLEAQGYAVYATGDPFEAIERCRRGPCDLLLTDVVMPKLGGRTVARRVRAVAPDTRIILMSGYVDGSVDDIGFPFLQKPFTSEVLARTVRDVLEGRALSGGGFPG